ncbi:MAG: hypothetical protein CMH52_06410 [Myxococcales bacterium]|nr:hypothetical protein [Myxococcales bacterium]
MKAISNDRKTAVRPVFWWSLVLVILGLLLLIAAIQVIGAKQGEPCVDSYSCSGFLIAGSECVETETERYCSKYCQSDQDCPDLWRCGDANPTVLTFETELIDTVCVKLTPHS